MGFIKSIFGGSKPEPPETWHAWKRNTTMDDVLLGQEVYMGTFTLPARTIPEEAIAKKQGIKLSSNVRIRVVYVWPND